MTASEDTKRHVREGTAKAMRSMTRTCANCLRGQNPRKHTIDGLIVWTCRYCGHEHSTGAKS